MQCSRATFYAKKLAPALLLPILMLAFYNSVYIADHIRSFLTVVSCKSPNSSHQLLSNDSIGLPSICWSDSCRSDYTEIHLQNEVRPIPAIRHILWRDEFVSENFVRHLSTWQKIHSNWTYVLWRDQDMEPFVAAHFPDILPKFKSLPDRMMRVDMIRYMLLYKYGGVYADLDYTLVRGLDHFRSNYAVLTQEPEAHSLQFFGMTWPVKLLVSPAFMMSAPGHAFFYFVTQSLKSKPPNRGELHYAGPFGLTEITENYRKQCSVGSHEEDIVIVPPSFSFFPYRDNRLEIGRGTLIPDRLRALRDQCSGLTLSKDSEQQKRQQNHPLMQFCTDVTNMDPITDKSQPVFAIHDMEKPGPSYARDGTLYFSEKPTDIRRVLKNLKFGREFI